MPKEIVERLWRSVIFFVYVYVFKEKNMLGFGSLILYFRKELDIARFYAD